MPTQQIPVQAAALDHIGRQTSAGIKVVDMVPAA